jgi:uncharacterized repeat protein (TIGR01451 family)
MSVRARISILTCVIACSLAAMPAIAAAVSYEVAVTTTEDRGLTENSNYCSGEGAGGEECPLRAALETARNITFFGGEEIVVAVPAGHYLLSKGTLPLGDAHAKSCVSGITKPACPVTLRGAGAGQTIIDGQGASRLITTTEEAGPVTIAGVELTHGAAKYGGAIYSYLTELTVRESLISENEATELGGAIEADYSPGLVVENSSITHNVASYGGGILAHVSLVEMIGSTLAFNHASSAGGGLTLEENAGLGAIVTDSTIANNTAVTSGGGIAALSTSLVLLHYSTVTANTATEGGGVFGADPLAIEGSVLADDSPDECAAAKNASTAGVNIIFGASSCSFSGLGPLAVDPRLGPLSANGGLGATAPLLHGSPALNAGGTSCPAADAGAGQVDERGIRRPQGGGCDLGALESAADAGIALAASPNPAIVGGSLSLTATASNAGAEPLTGVSVTIPVPTGASFVSAPAGCAAAFAATTTVTCQLGSLAPGQARSISIAIRPEQLGALVETASVSADQADYNSLNDSATIASVIATGVTKALPPGPTASATLLSRVLAVDSHGNVTIRARCTGDVDTRCLDTVAIYSARGVLPAVLASRGSRAILLARRHLVVAAGTTKVVRLHLDRAGMRLLKAHRVSSARLLLSAGGNGSAGNIRRYVVQLVRARHR